jgi:hypothetical protein
MHAMSMSARTNKPGNPVLVELGQGVIQSAAAQTFCSIVPHITVDPLLPVERAFTSMLTTLANIVARLSIYQLMPTALWRCVKSFNPTSWVQAIEEFLFLPETSLDVGFGLPLQTEALSKPNSSKQIAWMMSSTVVGIQQMTNIRNLFRRRWSPLVFHTSENLQKIMPDSLLHVLSVSLSWAGPAED